MFANEVNLVVKLAEIGFLAAPIDRSISKLSHLNFLRTVHLLSKFQIRDTSIFRVIPEINFWSGVGVFGPHL